MVYAEGGSKYPYCWGMPVLPRLIPISPSMTLKSNGAANAGIASDKAPNPARPKAILSATGLRDIRKYPFLFDLIKPNLVLEYCLWRRWGGRWWIAVAVVVLTRSLTGRRRWWRRLVVPLITITTVRANGTA